MNRLSIYLAGYIQGTVIEECKAWRNQIIDHYENWKDSGLAYPINWMNPLNGESEISDDGLKSSVPPNFIFHKDKQCVKRSDLLIVNMDTFGQDRPLTGTQWEMCWAEDNDIPIFMITKDQMHHEYPFYIPSISWYFESVDEMLEAKAINKLYKAYNTPQKD